MRPPAAPTSSRQWIGFAIAVAFGALLLLPGAARAASYWVGNNGNAPCTHATLQAAIDTAVGSAGQDLIYLVGPGPFTGPFTVLGGGIYLVGNVASCGSTISVGFATLRAPSGQRPLAILMGSPERVTLQRIVVTTQNGTFNGDGGCIWFAGASNSSRLDLITSQVSECTATGNGGGIYVSGGTVVVLTSAMVAANAATNGGGIAGQNGAVVEVRGGYVFGNTAFFDGGGIWAPDARVHLENGSIATETVVSNNIAGRDGGGLYLGASSQPHALSATPGVPPSVVMGNLAQRGGGLFVHGATVRIEYVSIDHNQAGAEGGGVFADGGGDTAVVGNAFVARAAYPHFEANTAFDGAALYLDDADARLGSGRIHGHQMGAGSGAVATVMEGLLFVHGLVVDANQAPALFALEDFTLLDLQHVTLSGNDVGGFVRWRGTSSEVNFYRSILDETEPFFASFESPSTPPQIDCILSRFASPFAVVPPGTDLTSVSFGDPQFVHAPFDYHLRHTSPAIDRCPSSNRTDNDGDERSHDDPYHPNGVGQTGDAGADEATVLFADGFESGSQGQWSSDFP